MTQQLTETGLEDQLHTREGLTKYLSTAIKRPSVLTRRAYDALTDTERDAYNQKRLDYLSGGLTVRTPEMQLADKLVAKAKLASSRRPYSANGLIVSGPPTVGKTTILIALMKTVWSRCHRDHPDMADGRVPVVYIEVPSGSTGRLLMVELAAFFGITATRRDTKDILERRVINLLYAARTELIVIDELHNLEAANRGNGESVDALKVLRDKVNAEFVFAGFHLEDSALLTG
jgi:Cdc6-like AAA superfamily ATPase